MSETSAYLREQALRCVRLARTCPHTATAHELEALSIELMEKAAELDDLLAMPLASPANARTVRSRR